jgi:hypothetical protein
MPECLQEPCQIRKSAENQAFCEMNEYFPQGEYSTVGEISQFSGLAFRVTARPGQPIAGS